VFSAILAAILSFAITACIWWVYFDFLTLAPFTKRLGSGQPYIYLHLPLQIGLSLLSIGFARAIRETVQSMLQPETCWFIGAGSILWMISGMLLKLINIQERLSSPWVFIRYALFVVFILLLLFIKASIAPLLFLTVFSTLILIFTIFDVWYWYEWSNKQTEKNGPEYIR
jgi:low temperature requirement protein LtrA